VSKLAPGIKELATKYREINLVEQIKLFFKLSQPKPELIEVYPKETSSLKIHLTSMTYMYNVLQNDSDKVLILDTRSLIDQMRSHLNFNFKNDSHIPIPSDLILNRNLDAVEKGELPLKISEF